MGLTFKKCFKSITTVLAVILKRSERKIQLFWAIFIPLQKILIINIIDVKKLIHEFHLIASIITLLHHWIEGNRNKRSTKND